MRGLVSLVSLAGLVGLAVLLGSLGAGCAKKASREECEKLVSHVADLALKNMPEGFPGGEQMRAQIMKGVDDCAKHATREEVACGMKASTMQEFEACQRK